MAYFAGDGTAIIRASAIGSCETALIHSLLGQTPAAPPESMQRRFDDGHLHEPAILDYLRGLGWEIWDDQDTVAVPVSQGIVIVGHVDGLTTNVAQEKYVVECKSMSEMMFRLWKSHGIDAFPRYAMQISLYMRGTGRPALYAVKNKNSGEIDVCKFWDEPYSIAKLKAKAIRVVRLAKAGEVPDCQKPYDFPCPFFHLHPAEVEPGDVPQMPGLADLCADYVRAKDQVKFWQEKADAAKAVILEDLPYAEPVVSAGDYEIKKTVVTTTRFDTKKYRADNPEDTRYDTTTETVRLDVSARPQDTD